MAPFVSEHFESFVLAFLTQELLAPQSHFSRASGCSEAGSTTQGLSSTAHAHILGMCSPKNEGREICTSVCVSFWSLETALKKTVLSEKRMLTPSLRRKLGPGSQLRAQKTTPTPTVSWLIPLPWPLPSLYFLNTSQRLLWKCLTISSSLATGSWPSSSVSPWHFLFFFWYHWSSSFSSAFHPVSDLNSKFSRCCANPHHALPLSYPGDHFSPHNPVFWLHLQNLCLQESNFIPI